MTFTAAFIYQQIQTAFTGIQNNLVVPGQSFLLQGLQKNTGIIACGGRSLTCPPVLVPVTCLPVSGEPVRGPEKHRPCRHRNISGGSTASRRLFRRGRLSTQRPRLHPAVPQRHQWYDRTDTSNTIRDDPCSDQSTRKYLI